MSSNAAERTAVEEPEGEEPAGLPAPEETILRMRHSIVAGGHWFPAVLEAIGRWRLPEETVHGRTYRYLVGGEAFDWLLLAERLLEEVSDLVPPAERDGLLFDGRWPVELDDETFAASLGAAKHSAHLNFLYGVLVEEALQLSIEEDIHKENRSRAWGADHRADETMYQRVYGIAREDLMVRYYEETGCKLGRRIAYGDWKAFTYWLFKLRLRRQDKARVASDTRRGLAQLTRMELTVSERRRGAVLDEEDFATRFGT